MFLVPLCHRTIGILDTYHTYKFSLIGLWFIQTICVHSVIPSCGTVLSMGSICITTYIFSTTSIVVFVHTNFDSILIYILFWAMHFICMNDPSIVFLLYCFWVYNITFWFWYCTPFYTLPCFCWLDNHSIHLSIWGGVEGFSSYTVEKGHAIGPWAQLHGPGTLLERSIFGFLHVYSNYFK